MKKSYVSPVMVVVDVEAADMLAASVAAYRGPVTSKEGDVSNDRVTWGSLWQ